MKSCRPCSSADGSPAYGFCTTVAEFSPLTVGPGIGPTGASVGGAPPKGPGGSPAVPTRLQPPTPAAARRLEESPGPRPQPQPQPEDPMRPNSSNRRAPARRAPPRPCTIISASLAAPQDQSPNMYSESPGAEYFFTAAIAPTTPRAAVGSSAEMSGKAVAPIHPPSPEYTATYCLPSGPTNVIGLPTIPEPVLNCQSTLPVRASTARNQPSMVP